MALTVAAVVACELINTAIEALADHLHPAQHPAIGLTKDVAAAAVLVCSLASLAVGTAFLVGHLWPWWRSGPFG
jgi:diacylglycerol kinase